jgi:hypothetical protein
VYLFAMRLLISGPRQHWLFRNREASVNVSFLVPCTRPSPD